MNNTIISEDSANYKRYQLKVGWLSILAIALIAALLLALTFGAISINVIDLLLSASENNELERQIFTEIRLPRVILAAFCGAALALVGAVLQGLFRNPLADPGLIGVSSGAATGAIAWLTLGHFLSLSAELNVYLLPLSACVGGVFVTLLLYFMGKYWGRYSLATMLLIGIALNAISLSIIGVFQFISDDTQLRSLTFWLMGSFGRAQWPTLTPVIITVTGCAIFLLFSSKKLDRLQLGESTALTLGVDVRRIKIQLVIVSAIAVGSVVAISGIINFIGLVVPHIVRLIGGANHRFVLPAAMILGSILTVLSDLVARMLLPPAELPVGLITSLIGAPFFLWLIARSKT